MAARRGSSSDRGATQEDSRDYSGNGSAEASHPGSAGGQLREKKRVGFTGGTESDSRPTSRNNSVTDEYPAVRRSSMTDEYESFDISAASSPMHSPGPYESHQLGVEPPSRAVNKSHLPVLSPQQTREIHKAFDEANLPRPRPAIRRTAPPQLVLPEEEIEGPDETGQRAFRRARAKEAFERGKRLEEDEKSAPPSRYGSPERPQIVRAKDIPLEDLRSRYSSEDDSDDPKEQRRLQRAKSLHHAEAHRLVRNHAAGKGLFDHDTGSAGSGGRSGVVTPIEEKNFADIYRPRPQQYRGGVLGALLKLYNQPQNGDGTATSRNSSLVSLIPHRRPRSGDWESVSPTPQHSPPESGTVTPSGGSPGGTGGTWFARRSKPQHQSHQSLAHLIGSSASLSSPVVSGLGEQVSQRLAERKTQERPKLGKRVLSSDAIKAFNRFSSKKAEVEARITKHIAETLARQRYLMRLCRALMMYGAPTHRLEEYMTMSARVLEVEAQFLYIPGSMLISFDDLATHTTEVKLVKVAQGLDLGRLRDVHEVYKEVVHDLVGVDEATARLKETMGRMPKYNRLMRIPVYGMAAVCVGPFAFDARLIDLPMAFILGCILGVLQLVVAPASDLYANVFEVAAAVITSFLARALGSIPYNGGRLFCFSALAQSSLALILPGYIVLCASLELQSRNLVAGSVRMVYAVIYSLFLGFGLTVGISIYGLIDSNATTETTCPDPMADYWFFFFVPAFALCLAIINQAKWKQIPAMLVIAFAGYVTSYFSSKRFAGNTQISSMLGALVIGVMANLYSRLGSRVENWWLDQWEDRLRPRWRAIRRRALGRGPKGKHARTSNKAMEEGRVAGDGDSAFVRAGRRVGYSLAAAAMLPAIFVQVPSGLGIEGSLVAGLDSAAQIAGTSTNGSTVVNATTLADEQESLNGIAFDVGYSVIQVAIGITVGLFLSAIVVYPVGKKRSGLFSF